MAKKKYKSRKSRLSHAKKVVSRRGNDNFKKLVVSQKRFDYNLLPDSVLFACYEKDSNKDYTKVVNVSLTIEIKKTKYTIARLDSEHGYLHLHLMRSTRDQTEDLFFVTNDGNPHEWLTFAIEFIGDFYIEIREAFLKRSGIKVYY